MCPIRESRRIINYLVYLTLDLVISSTMRWLASAARKEKIRNAHRILIENFEGQDLLRELLGDGKAIVLDTPLKRRNLCRRLFNVSQNRVQLQAALTVVIHLQIP